MKLSIIVPVYNEEKTIEKVLDKLLSVKLSCKKEVIIVNDGSTDGTRKRIKNYELRIKKAIKRTGSDQMDFPGVKEIKIIHHPKNLGKGVAIQTGIKKATGDYILIQDADLEYNPEEIPKLLKPIKTPRGSHDFQPATPEVKKSENNFIAVYGSRFKKKQAIIPLLYLIGNKFLTLLTNILYGTKLTDMETGYKLLPASFIKKVKLKGKRFEIEPEITIKLVQNQLQIVEVPISYRGRTHLAGKKLTFKDAFSAIKTLLYYRFTPRR